MYIPIRDGESTVVYLRTNQRETVRQTRIKNGQIFSKIWVQLFASRGKTYIPTASFIRHHEIIDVSLSLQCFNFFLSLTIHRLLVLSNLIFGIYYLTTFRSMIFIYVKRTVLNLICFNFSSSTGVDQRGLTGRGVQHGLLPLWSPSPKCTTTGVRIGLVYFLYIYRILLSNRMSLQVFIIFQASLHCTITR